MKEGETEQPFIKRFALHAARLLYRLAVLDENPVAAARWEARADLQSRRLMPA